MDAEYLWIAVQRVECPRFLPLANGGALAFLVDKQQQIAQHWIAVAVTGTVVRAGG